MVDAPNLDAMTDDEAEKLRSRIALDMRNTARELFPDRPAGYQKATDDLHRYLCSMLQARTYRRRGLIMAAVCCEDICELIYRQLPELARW